MALIVVGSNIEPERYIPPAIAALKALGEVRAVSRMFQSPAVGKIVQPDFVNGAVWLDTRLDAAPLYAALHAIEDDLGRVRAPGPRRIDLDLCLLGDVVLFEPPLRLPHPEILKFAHVAVSMAELAPGVVHPQTGETLAQIAARVGVDFVREFRADIEAAVAAALVAAAD